MVFRIDQAYKWLYNLVIEAIQIIPNLERSFRIDYGYRQLKKQEHSAHKVGIVPVDVGIRILLLWCRS